MLGVSTSLPEVICCIDLAHKKEYNMLISTMVGSCCFNFFILGLGNIVLSFVSNGQGLMYEFDKYSIIQIIILVVIIIVLALYFYFNKHKNINKKNKIIYTNIFFLSLVVITFIIYLFLNLSL